MYLKKIELKNFRNYESTLIEFDKKINLICGDNAQGKTNLLESIYFSSIGKSFRKVRDIEMIRFGCTFADIKIDFEKDNEENSLEIILNKEGRKSAKLNEVNLKKISQLIENILVVTFSPEDLKLIKEEPKKRREFINIELCKIKPSYYSNLLNYKKILKQRNAYLKSKKIDKNILKIWDDQLVNYGSKVVIQREEFINKIEKISNKIHNEITNKKENLEIEYKKNIKGNNLEEIKIEFNKRLKENLKEDLKQMTTTCGPHKDDIEFKINNLNARKFGSQGQQRTIALSVKLAELYLIKEETGDDAILLLDDVMSELDYERQEFLIKAFKHNQLFITTTNIPEEIEKKLGKKKKFIVKEGQIVEKIQQ